MSALVVEGVGPLATVQDLGRPGHAALGVPAGGAADRAALRLGNRLVGNPEDEPGLEVLLGGLRLRVEGNVTVCLTGAPAAVTRNGSAAPICTPVPLRDGDRLHLGMPPTGLRSYLAIRGGLAVTRVLGSASTDLTAGLGPPPLEVGRRLPVAVQPAAGLVCGEAVDVASPWSAPVDDLVLRVVLGPRVDWFDAAALRALTAAAWTVTSEADRVGVRLCGPHLDRSRGGELPSEGIVRGAVQVPTSGQPLVFLAEHPTTGGYPVIAVVLDVDVDALAQVRPGQRVRFSRRRPPW